MRDSAYELTFTIVRKDNGRTARCCILLKYGAAGRSITAESFGYETVAQFKVVYPCLPES